MSTTTSGTASTRPHDHSSFSSLRQDLHGTLILPEDDGYDDARKIFNAMIDRHPAAIARCVDSADVAVAVNFARDTGIPVAVRAGGHSVAGESMIDGGLVIDLSPMKRVEVNPETRIAKAQAGLRLEEFIEATERHGLVSPTGTVADTGIAGLTLGGGFGWLCGKYGMAVDNVAGAEVVLADGSVVHASPSEHEDLFWAIRGGSGNFGVVTEFEMMLHPLTQVLGGMLIHPIERAPEILRFYRETVPTLPDELTLYTALLTGPDGNKAIAMVTCWSGTLEEGERVLAPIRAFGPPVADTIQPMTYSAMNRLLGEGLTPGMRNYWKQSYFRTVDDDFIDIVIDFAHKAPSPRSVVLIDELHGAASRVAPTDTAFPHREARFGLVMLGVWTDPAEDDVNISWTRELAAATRPFGTGGVYVNEAVGEKSRAAFGENYDRLAEIKARYDPGNFFRHNTNIIPAALPNSGRAAD
jgi:FAD/FMN-containing dehydrogenase